MILAKLAAYTFIFACLLLYYVSGMPAYAQSPGSACTATGLTSPIWVPGGVAGGTGQLLVCNGSNWILLLEYGNDGNVGIGMTVPDVELDVDGDIEYTGTIADRSDRRLKTDIENLSSGQLEKITALQGVSFKMKDDPEGEMEYGFIAQDVQPYFPSLVLTRRDGMLSFNYVGMIAPMVEAIKTLKSENEELRVQTENLRMRISRLEEKE